MIAIVDYGVGNLTSVRKALEHLGRPCRITSDRDTVARAAKIILPGVGHFASTTRLSTSGLAQAIAEATSRGIPFLGICVGMQWMFESSEESPQTPGWGIVPGACARFPPEVKSPHVGWNQLDIAPASRLMRSVQPGAFVFFTHSYRGPILDSTSARCDYGGSFSAAIEQDNFFGVQFHPEKSGAAGLQILKNFCEL